MGQRMRDRGCRIEDAGQEGLWYLPSVFGGVREPCSFYRAKALVLEYGSASVECLSIL